MVYALKLAAWIIGGVILKLLVAVCVLLLCIFIAMQRDFKKTINELLKHKNWREV